MKEYNITENAYKATVVFIAANKRINQFAKLPHKRRKLLE